MTLAEVCNNTCVCLKTRGVSGQRLGQGSGIPYWASKWLFLLFAMS